MPFYRILDDTPGIGDDQEQSTKRRWERGQTNCSHRDCPEEWQALWNGNQRDKASYSLNCVAGRRSEAALDSFLSLAKAKGAQSSAWTEMDCLAVGELDGTCAFRTPEAAWAYAFPDPEKGYSEDKVANVYFAIFTGEDMNIEIPEKQKGGIQVRVEEIGIVYSAYEFAETFDFDVPPEPPPAPDLPFEEEVI